MELTSKLIIEYNELIAKFMGGIFRTDLNFTFIKSGWENTPANDICHIAQSHQFKYHSSWDWLMPVVEKIENCKDDQSYSTRIDIWKNGCRVTFGNDTHIFDYILATSKIESVWLACVEFIKWYSSNLLDDSTDLIEKLVNDKANKNNTIDLNAYALGLEDMYKSMKFLQKEFGINLKIIGYKAPFDLFKGRIKKGEIFSEYSKDGFVMYNKNHLTSGIATEIVKTWEVVYSDK